MIDITELQVQALEDIAKAEKLSRAAVIRAAIDEYVLRRNRAETNEAFGLWGDGGMDGLSYQEKARSEW
ncbi:ribbon-helix-helix protein, CopG family [Rhizobium herbae]|uniref:Metal-responsive CopG/Arc/MetJ family transcriptional regulator n=1 Tax=Rhizobium herbae TaxID=508661 RepID=A0ABS4ELF8_9HYPH|nr:metal-responsive CopG/Arc/MetJ family transcriptional regulator [Rhizobium herbae]